MKINNYVKDTNVNANDKWIGSDFNNFGQTKNFSPTSIAEYYNHNQVIDSPYLKFTYQTLNPGEQRYDGTISFVSEIGPSVAFSSISTFLLSKKSLKDVDVSNYIGFLNGGKIILSRGENIDDFGFYKITDIIEYVTDTNFFVVSLDYVAGHGSMVEDKDYIISLLADSYTLGEIPTKTSDLINDGEDGTNPFITLQDLPPSASTLQDVVNNGNGISNFGGLGSADIQSTNFSNNRTLYLNNDLYPTIKLVDNADASHNLTIDLDTLNINGTSYNWSSIVSGGAQTLNQVLTEDNQTLGRNILLNNADAIELENTSLLKKGTYDFGGQGGISRVCSVGYEDMWQSGIRHVFDNNGLIRNSTNGFNIIPDVYFDSDLRFKAGSIWTLDDGTSYICTDATVGAAVWEIHNAIPTVGTWGELDYPSWTTGTPFVKMTDTGTFTLDTNIYAIDADVVHKTGDENIDGNKNFTGTATTKITLDTRSGQGIFGGVGALDNGTNFYSQNQGTGIGMYANTGDIGIASQFETIGTGDSIVSRASPTGTGRLFVGKNANTETSIIDKLGNITANSFIKTGGTSSQFLMADGSVSTGSGGGLPVGGTAGQILTKVDGTDYNATWQENYADWTSVVKHTVKNNGVGLITKGTPVYVTSSSGTNMLVGKASNTSEATSSKTMGLMQSDITTTGGTQTGFVVTEGLLGGLNTAGTTAGDPVWLGVNGALIYGLINKPYAPAHLVFIGIVTKVSAGSGEIFVKVQNGFELKEIHDVDLITNTPTNGQAVIFESSTSLWRNKTIIEDSITDGVTDKAPSQNSVFDALALKQNTLVYTPFKWIATNTTPHTGTLSETAIAVATINGGTFNSSDVMKVFVQTSKPLTIGIVSYRIRINTTNTLAGAVTIGSFSTSNTLSYAPITRTHTLAGNNLIGNFGNAVSDLANTAGNIGSTAYNTANTLYVFFTVQLGNVLDSATINLMTITN